MLNLSTLAASPAFAEPFPFFAAQNALDAQSLAAIGKAFPAVPGPGIFPLSELDFGMAFAELIADIESAELEALLEEKLCMRLSGRPLMITVRGFCRARDGRIHNDSKDKIATCLLYLNEPGWNAEGGRLRLLRDGNGLDNAVAEIAPDGGNFVAFKRTENSWHGHASYEGPRRYIMFNWLTSDVALAKNVGRHRISAAFKRLGLRDHD
ncbi:MAG TPA: 2OG-Fe(II) oxygenase [Rhizomicrobium sp.]|nr:2OG-Fe(II) oxygenase [Rhizomicrobium sp.]